MVDRLPKEEFDYIYSKVPRLCVDLVVKKDGGYLLTKRDVDPWKGQWHLPGGGVKLRETIPNTIKRIAKDELNITVDNPKLIGYIECYSMSEVPGYAQPVNLVFEVDAKDQEITLDFQASEYKVFKDEVPENTIIDQKKFLQKYFKLE